MPANWQHPQETKYNPFLGVDETRYVPLFNSRYIDDLNEWLKNHQAWEDGTHEAFAKYGHTKEEFPFYANYGGNPPEVEYYRPDWKPEEMTWWQVYETVSEGTPVTPAFSTAEELIEYLVINGDFWDKRRGDGPWSRKNAEAFVKDGGWAPSMVLRPKTGLISGVQALGEFK